MLRLWRRRIWAIASRVVNGTWEVRWFLLSALLASVGLADIWADVPDMVAVVLGALSVVLLVMELRHRHLAAARIAFGDQPYDAYDDVRVAIECDERYELLSYRAGAFLVDHAATRWIAGNGKGELLREPYSLPVELGEVATTFRRRRVRWRLDVFNGPVVGLDSNLRNLPPADGVVQFRPGRYFDHLSSDLFATVNATIQRREAPWFGRALYIDRHGVPRDFGDSWLLNAVGTSIVAVTTDGALVAVHQTDRNESSKNLLAPSGSGSLEPQDFQTAASACISDIAAAGAVREMHDEAGIGWGDIGDVRFLGFGRWLNKGGKPELLLVANLTIDSHEARRRNPQRHDTPFSKFADPIRLRPPSGWIAGELDTILFGSVEARLSLPLLASLHLMASAAQDQGSSVGGLIRQQQAL